MKVMIKCGLFLLTFAAILASHRPNTADAFSNYCTDHWLTGQLDGPDSVQGGVPANFSGFVSINAGESGGPVSYWLDYGDGTHDNGRSTGPSKLFSHYHTYASSGPYTVTASFNGRDGTDNFSCDVPYTTN